MEAIICDISAFLYWRTPPIVRMLASEPANGPPAARPAHVARGLRAPRGARQFLPAVRGGRGRRQEPRAPWVARERDRGLCRGALGCASSARRPPRQRTLPAQRVRTRSSTALLDVAGRVRHLRCSPKRWRNHSALCAPADRRPRLSGPHRHACLRTLRVLLGLRCTRAHAHRTPAPHRRGQAPAHIWVVPRPRPRRAPYGAVVTASAGNRATDPGARAGLASCARTGAAHARRRTRCRRRGVAV